jgi:hypothetical protein
MDRKSGISIIFILLGGGIAAYGMFTESGPVGWLNALQSSMFGSYYGLVSAFVVMASITLVCGFLWDTWARIRGKEPDGVFQQILRGPGTVSGKESSPGKSRIP